MSLIGYARISTAAHQSIRSIAGLMGRSPSTVSREIRRNGGDDDYRAAEADERAWERARRPKRCQLVKHPQLRRVVARKLSINWSPEQIANWLKRAYPKDPSYHVSHETIYRSLFVQARGALKAELMQHLRSKRTIRRSRHASLRGHGRGQITDIVSIRERPASVEDRAVPGHWEGDLLSGSKNSHIATLVERHTRYVMLTKVSSKKTETVVSALIKHAKKLPTELYKSLTWDRGLELAEHRRFTLATDISWGHSKNTSSPFHETVELDGIGLSHVLHVAAYENQAAGKEMRAREANGGLSEQVVLFKESNQAS